jgi:alpha-mannosidase
MDKMLEFDYAVVPHSGKWTDAGISSINSAWNEALITHIINNNSANISSGYSFIEASDKHIEIPTLYVRNKALYVRLFNSNDKSTESDLFVNYGVQKIESAELDGTVIKEMEIKKGSRQSLVHLNFRPFEIKTLKIQ